MRSNFDRRGLLASTMLAGVLVGAGFATLAEAQTTPAPDSEVVVTGSRIRRAADDTAAPVTIINAQDFSDRGFINAGQALNDITSNTPVLPIASGNGSAVGSGQTFPNLFNLGAGRTLTLVDGRRFVTSTSGGDRVVDTTIIPTGLVDRIDVVEAGGAAVYGSDAIAGVINYVLKKNFNGVEVDAQAGISSRGDYPENSFRATIGHNFAGGRGNIAFDGEWSQTRPLLWADRPETASPRVTLGLVEVRPATFWEFNRYGVVFGPAPAPVASFIRGQFSPDGSTIVPYNTGAIAGVPFATGDGTSYRDLASLATGVERYSGTFLGHYDLNDHAKLSGSFFYGRTRGDDPYGSQASNTVLNAAATGAGAIAFNKNNPYLTAADIATISAAVPSFGAGGSAFLSKFFDDLLPTRRVTYDTSYYRGLASLDGDFNAGARNYYYSLSYSHAEVDGNQQGWGVNTAHFNNAVAAVKNSAGQIVCGINATMVVDAACAPLNPFGIGNISAAARAYVTVPVGQRYRNLQDDALGTIGGKLIDLPGGEAKFSLGYEYRAEFTSFSPDLANQLGQVGSGTPTAATHGSYNTNEYSAEVLVPVLGPKFNLPFAKSVEVSGQYRYVDNSLAGTKDVWGLGLRWEVVTGLSLRASRSQNFRAPTLTQLLAPTSVTLGSLGGGDPCDFRYISAGSSPSTRLTNCQALFAAHPSWGSLAAFQDPSVNFNNANITSGGNPKLQNEVSDTTTYGFVYQPQWVPGRLNLQIDRIEIKLQNGITSLLPYQFLAACYDAPGSNNSACSTFTRDPTTGFVTAAQSTTFNAASVEYHGETFNLDYRFPLSWFSYTPVPGSMEVQLQATHNESLKTNIVGSLTSISGTIAEPRWVTRFDLRYASGPLRVTYSAFYLPEALSAQGATGANTLTPLIGSNFRQDISATYTWRAYQFRAGVTNFGNEKTSFPTLSYGDIIGREFFVGVKAKY